MTVKLVLIGYWPLNETSGGTAYDHSGKEYSGTVNNGGDSTVVGDSEGPTGENAYSFDGSNDYVQLPFDVSQFGNISISAWVRPKNTFSNLCVLGSRDIGDTNDLVRLELTSGSLTFQTIDSGTSTYGISSVSSYNSDEWVQVVGTFDSNQGYKLYKNMEEVGSSGKTTFHTNGVNEQIGRRNDGSNFNGAISEVRLYNRVLTPREIQYLYNVSQRGRMVSSKKKS